MALALVVASISKADVLSLRRRGSHSVTLEKGDASTPWGRGRGKGGHKKACLPCVSDGTSSTSGGAGWTESFKGGKVTGKNFGRTRFERGTRKKTTLLIHFSESKEESLSGEDRQLSGWGKPSNGPKDATLSLVVEQTSEKSPGRGEHRICATVVHRREP